MTTKKWTDPTTGENFVEDIINLPLSGLAYLKYLPYVCVFLVIQFFLLVSIWGLLYDIDKNLGVVIKKHLYVVTYGAQEIPTKEAK